MPEKLAKIMQAIRCVESLTFSSISKHKLSVLESGVICHQRNPTTLLVPGPNPITSSNYLLNPLIGLPLANYLTNLNITDSLEFLLSCFLVMST